MVNGGKILFGGISIGTAGLGVWQSKRYFQKAELIAENNKKLLENPKNISGFSPQELYDIPSTLADSPLQVEGVFDHSREILLGPRSAPQTTSKGGAKGMSTNPMGYFVITPLRLQNGHYVFINRGWVGRNRKSWSRPEGKVVISGLYQPFEKKNYFSPESKVTARTPRPSASPSGDISSDTESSPTPSTLIWLEESAVMENALSNTSLEADYVPLILEHIDTSTVSKKDAIVFPFPRNTYEVQHFVGPETHVAYAFTWFSLSMASAYMIRRMK